jgi:hypothetical protein
MLPKSLPDRKSLEKDFRRSQRPFSNKTLLVKFSESYQSKLITAFSIDARHPSPHLAVFDGYMISTALEKYLRIP